MDDAVGNGLGLSRTLRPDREGAAQGAEARANGEAGMADPLSISGIQSGQAAGAAAKAGGADATGAAGGKSFKDTLLDSLDQVNQLQQEADQKLEDFVSGKTSNMGEVISASQKASMAFSLLTQIRNKLQDSYDELKNLRV